MIGSVGFGLLQLGFSPGVAAFVVSIIPLLGLREAMAVSSFVGFSFVGTLVMPILGSTIATILALLIMRRIFDILQTPGGARLLRHKHRPIYIVRILRRVAGSSSRRRKSLHGLLFVIAAIPIPLTGPWLCASIATAMDIPMADSFAVIAAGTALCALLMLVIALILPGTFGIFI